MDCLLISLPFENTSTGSLSILLTDVHWEVPRRMFSSHLTRICWIVNEYELAKSPPVCFYLGAILWVDSGFCNYYSYTKYSQVGQNILMLTHLSISPYDHKVTWNMSSSEITLKITHFDMLPFMKYHCDSIFLFSLIQHEKLYMEKTPQKISLTVYC